MQKTILKQKPIAIVGMACRLPGAKNIQEFWNLIAQGKNAIAPVPEERFNRKLYYNSQKGVVGRSYCDKAALIDYSEVSVPNGRLTAESIKNYDPAHLMLCRVTEEAIQHSRIPEPQLQNQNIGIFIGHAASSGLGSSYTYGIHVAQVAEYLRGVEGFDSLPESSRESMIRELVDQVRKKTPWRTRENNPRLSPGDASQLVSDFFHLTGPAMIFNSACASSLQAIGHGMKSLQLGRIDAAVVGGAACFHSDTLVLFSAAQSLSPNGSYPFTEKADGLIPCEGYVVFLLKTLEKAIADGNEIHAVLPDIGISSDGKGASLWAPRKEGQIEAMARAYEAGTDISKLEYIEGHITSTHLGDKTEITSITELFQKRFGLKKRIPIGSVKRNLGHALEVAGAIGLLKVVLALKHETIPSAVEPGIPLNKDIPWESVPVFPPSENLRWAIHQDGTPRLGAVNAFGIGGLNVHLLVEDYPAGSSVVQPIVSAAKPEDERAVAIIGTGAVLPGALNLQEFRSSLESSERTVKPLPKTPWDAQLFSDRQRWGGKAIKMPGGGVIENFHYDWKRHGIPPKQLTTASPLQFMILEAVDQAIQQAGFSKTNDFDHLRTGCIVGTMFGGNFSAQLSMGLRLPEIRNELEQIFHQNGLTSDSSQKILDRFEKKVLNQMPALLDETGSFTSSALASRITKTYNLMGGGVAIDSGNGSAMAALGASIDMLLTKSTDMMICVAGQSDLTPGMFAEFELSGNLASTLDFSSPYSAKSKGVLPGEGCVVLVLKRFDEAKRNGDNILGIIRGIGNANHTDAGQAVIKAVERSLEDGKVEADLIRSVELVGLGSSEADQAELTALESAYFRTKKDKRPLPIGTSVGKFGHLGSVSGLVSLLSGLIALEQETLAATAAYQEPSEPSKKFIVSGQSQRIGTTDPQGRLLLGVNVHTDIGTCFHLLLQRGTPVKPEPTFNEMKRSSRNIENLSHKIVHFDATALRRERLRSGGIAKPVEKTVPAPILAAPSAVPSAKNKVVIPVSAPSPVAPPKPATVSVSTQPDPKELETFLINFVIEQTGYPKEMVDLDANLETDLSIDSIKKAQLFGELGEYFDVQPTGDVTLDDFQTLRSVLNFLLKNATSANAEQPKPAPKAEPVTTAAPATSTPDPKELETFLINFVIEQTGYPKEMVDLDANLETDLSIDSIKKAQLFGELGEYFDVQPTGDVTLDDFQTLRSVLNFLLKNATSANAEQPKPVPKVEAVVAAPATSTPDPKELETFLVNFVIEQTGYPKEMVDLDANLETDLSIDSIKKAQLFGELGEYFDVQPTGDVTLDDFQTLRSVHDFLLKA